MRGTQHTQLMRFLDRTQAGKLLAERLSEYANQPDVLILGLPRGGVPVAFEVASALHAPLDLLIVRKLGMPGEEELAIGAIASGGVRVLNEEVIRIFQVSAQMIERVTAQERRELSRREQLYRGNLPPPYVRGRTIILVDDGVATGSTMRAAIMALRHQRPTRLVVAVPVAPRAVCDELRPLVDELVCLLAPKDFLGVGAWYRDYSQTSDDEVRVLFARARAEIGRSPVSPPCPSSAAIDGRT